MSTKIYAAWRCPYRSLPELLEAVCETRRLWAEQHGQWLVENFLSSILDADETPASDALSAYRGVIALLNKVRDENLNVNLNFDAGVRVYLSDGWALFTAWGTDIGSFVNQTLASVPDAEDFSYWDNADPKADVDATTWARRGHDWSKALDRDRVVTIPFIDGRIGEPSCPLTTPLFHALIEHLSNRDATTRPSIEAS